ncbi:MAP7 domain-containing protein 1 isoform X2 [Selaginella moellendorffii]|uniref:MAP7 domain-containing protein 1 isoform X2 n=1 Tax=Selaginella moellendorffii TaxID=88036 RepID=UPI000D1CFFD8|nr:MAP7 domain-containing protein 1 isoform X2 [Selaginella moellendorffii]|eukprot:XP_024541303.1 MAP7 domain-containing protein 1 isoform X2 [Selaginella moellendorffii]
MKGERKFAITFSPEFVTKLLNEDDKKVIPAKPFTPSPSPPPPQPRSLTPPPRPPLHALLTAPLSSQKPPQPPPKKEEQKEGEIVSKSHLDLGLDARFGASDEDESRARGFDEDGPGKEVATEMDRQQQDLRKEEIEKQEVGMEDQDVKPGDETRITAEVPAAAVARDLQPLMGVLEKTEKHGEELQKRGISELEEMKKRAEELQHRHRSESAPRTQPCAAEKDACIECYQKLVLFTFVSNDFSSSSTGSCAMQSTSRCLREMHGCGI